MYNSLTNQYPVTKMLQFSLIPQGKTLDHIREDGLLDRDEKRAEDFIKVKKMIDEYHREYIDKKLRSFKPDGLDDYEKEYYSEERDNDRLEEIAASLRTQISNHLKDDKNFKGMFQSPMIKTIMPEHKKDDPDALALLEEFSGFTTYFIAYHKNRLNMYTPEPLHTGVAHRLIDQNLPKFLNNKKALEEALSHEEIKKAVYESPVISPLASYDYTNAFTQEGITQYNAMIGGISVSERERIQGINEIINLYNQKHKTRIGLLVQLHKQILSDKESLSFSTEAFESDNEVVDAIIKMQHDIDIPNQTLRLMLASIDTYDTNRIYAAGKNISALSHAVFGSWKSISMALGHKNTASLAEIEQACPGVIAYIKDQDAIFERADQAWKEVSPFLTSNAGTPLYEDDVHIALVKRYLDSLKDIQRTVSLLLGAEDIPSRDNEFYGEYESAWEILDYVTGVYNKVRNYITKKPYSTEKIKITFDNPMLMAGWDISKENDRRSVIFKDDNSYYLGIMKKKAGSLFKNAPEGDFKKMEYKQVVGANKSLPHIFLSRKGIDDYQPSETLLANYAKGTHKKGENFSLKDCHALIDYFKDCISKRSEWDVFGFHFSPTESYEDISGFYREVEAQGYKIWYRGISQDYINELVDNGQLYLFKIHSKDFSPYSKGTPSLYALYWLAAMRENSGFKLNGGGEVFYRKASIDDSKKIVHPAGKPIRNKNPRSSEKTGMYRYDIIKDRRYTKDQFSVHVSVTANYEYTAMQSTTMKVRELLRTKNDPYILAVDRGEHHLLYVSVIDPDGKIVEQRSLNVINNTDYFALLSEREAERNKERRSWRAVKKIKDLKNGYLSLAVHEITKMMVKYNAMVVLENLDFGFKQGRQKIERAVYQQFERALINKTNFLALKDVKEGPGSLLEAYQLTDPFESFKRIGKQTGVLLYTDAKNTNKIDPVSGFVNLFDTRYHSRAASTAFWSAFDAINYDADRDMFRFKFNYANFTDLSGDEWTIYSNDKRTLRYNDGKIRFKEVQLTAALKELFDDAGIDWKDGDLREAISAQDKAFYERLHQLFALIVQMRNGDHFISPVEVNGEFYDSRTAPPTLPDCGDANDAYHLALKGKMMVERIKEAEDLKRPQLAIKREEWFEYLKTLV